MTTNLNHRLDSSPAGRHGETQPCTLLEMEQTARELWIVEPQCDAAHRTQLLTHLTTVTRRIEQLSFRQQFHPETPVDGIEVRRCTQQLSDLVARWTPRRPDTALVA